MNHSIDVLAAPNGASISPFVLVLQTDRPYGTPACVDFCIMIVATNMLPLRASLFNALKSSALLRAGLFNVEFKGILLLGFKLHRQPASSGLRDVGIDKSFAPLGAKLFVEFQTKPSAIKPHRGDLFILYPFEQIPGVVFHGELLEHLNIFFLERFLAMMLFLILDVLDNLINLSMGIRERPEALLPIESSVNPFLLVDETGRPGLNVSDQIR